MKKWRALPILLGLIALLLGSAAQPHLHAGPDAGLWNQEHDLVLMATLGTPACPVDAMPVLGVAPSTTAPTSPTDAHPASAPRRLADSRAPPLS